MRILTYVSNLMIPLFIFGIVGVGLLGKRNIYDDFLDGAEEGLKTVRKIAPTLIGMLTAVGIVRESGFLTFLASGIGKATEHIGFPGDLVPLTVVRFFSSSAANGLLLDLFKKYGVDSRIGWAGALILGSTESIFYCMSVYFGSVGIRKTRYTLAGATLASAAGILAAMWCVNVYRI